MATPPRHTPLESQSAKTTERRILDSARHELARSGILGLRVAEVAQGAKCSITNIYRHFGDRDGLLARVLGDIMEEIVEATVEEFRTAIRSRSAMSIRDMVALLPFGPAFETLNHKFRLQILAAATENSILDERLHIVFARRLDLWLKVLAEAQQRMAPNEHFDERMFLGFIFDFMPFASVYLGPRRMTQDEFRALLADKLRITQPRS